jgi:hypothetical protein
LGTHRGHKWLGDPTRHNAPGKERAPAIDEEREQIRDVTAAGVA